MWSFEVKRLQTSQLPEHVLLPANRSSFCVEARYLHVPLGETATEVAILAKLDGFFIEIIVLRKL